MLFITDPVLPGLFIQATFAIIGGFSDVVLKCHASRLATCPQLRLCPKDESDTVRHFRQRLSVILIHHNMQMLLSGAPDTPPLQKTGDI